MNLHKYGSIYSRYHGCTTFRVHEDLIILDFTDEKWETWLVSRLHQAETISVQVPHAFAQALKVFYKTEAPLSVFCKQDSWTLMLGNERILLPMPDASAKLHLYATPYFVHDPQLVYDYLDGVARPAYDHIFSYKNSILYLDGDDIPLPGGCYFEAASSRKPMYRLCFLSQEPAEHIATLAHEWKTRRGIVEAPFQTRDVLVRPKCIPFQAIRPVDLPDTTSIGTGTIQKRLSRQRPECVLLDILNSYYRHQTQSQEELDTDMNPLQCVQALGLIVEWPFRIAFEGLHCQSIEETQKHYVALAVNGHRPSRVLQVRQPYERYLEYTAVPATVWVPLSYVPTVLETPDNVDKVSVDGIVIGFVYQSIFFSLSVPLLEGRPSHATQRHMNFMLNTGKSGAMKDVRVRIIETFRYNEEMALHHVQVTGVDRDAWCLCRCENVDMYPQPVQTPFLVQEWLSFVKQHQNLPRLDENVDAMMIRLALVLAKHKICFQTHITNTHKKLKKENQIVVTDEYIELCMGKKAADFINSARLEVTEGSLEAVSEESGCTIM